MAMCLSFSEEFFTGYGCDIYEMPRSRRPTNVLQAALSLTKKKRIEIGREVFGYDTKTAKSWADSESVGFDIVDKVRETNACDSYAPPVTVYIDDEGWFGLTIHEEKS